MEKLILGIYWGPRPEGLEVCAERLTTLVCNLRQVDTLLGSWYEGSSGERRDKRQMAKAVKRARELESIDEIYSGLTAEVEQGTGINLHRSSTKAAYFDLLKKGVNKRDTTGEIIEELGYSFELRNGEDSDADLAILRGAMGKSSRLLPNVITLEMSAERWMQQPLKVLEIFRAMCECMGPNFGKVFLNSYSRQANMKKEDWSGWMVYTRGEITMLPAGCISVKYGDGFIIQPQDLELDSFRKRVDQIAAQITNALKRAGIILTGCGVGEFSK